MRAAGVQRIGATPTYDSRNDDDDSPSSECPPRGPRRDRYLLVSDAERLTLARHRGPRSICRRASVRAAGAVAARAPVGGGRAERQAGARRRERTAARGGDDGLLGESFLRLLGQGTDAALPRGLRPRRDRPARARKLPRPARRRREESGDAVLPRSIPEHRGLDAHAAGWRGDATRAPAARAAGEESPRPERELRPRAARAAHPRCGWRLYAA